MKIDEFAAVRGFEEWDDWRTTNTNNTTATKSRQPPHLASEDALRDMDQIATSVRRYHRCPTEEAATNNHMNELVVLRFDVNHGCAFGFNDPIMTHPHAPYWLLVNHDVAYPPGVLEEMGRRLEGQAKSLLAIQTFGYVYGRGTLQNPFSNFAVTATSVARVGLFDEDVFPAYYEDDDYRDRVRYVLGKWEGTNVHLVGDTHDNQSGAHPKVTLPNSVDDTNMIRYDTDRAVAVVHGSLHAKKYIMGTYRAMTTSSGGAGKKNENQPPEQRCEKRRWQTLFQLADTQRYFRCKHGGLPEGGVLRYFDRGSRHEFPFGEDVVSFGNKGDERHDPWSIWAFNATRRRCVHEGANRILSVSTATDVAQLTAEIRERCAVC